MTEEKQLIGESTEIIETLNKVKVDMAGIGMSSFLHKIDDIIDDLILLQIRANDHINDNI